MKKITVKGVAGDFEISRIAFGTGSALKNLEKEEFFALFDRFAEYGGNVLDTAPGYNRGNSEKYIGEWMKLRGNRKEIFISTKACHSFEGEPSRLTYRDMMDDLNLSLSQLQTDYIDLFWIHNDDLSVPVANIVDDYNRVIETGKIRAVGCSNWTTERLEAANEYAASAGIHGFWANQIQWSLARAEEAYVRAYNALVMDDESYEWYLKHDVAVFAFSANARGFFVVAAKGGIEAVSERTLSFFGTPDNMKRLKNVRRYMEEHQVAAAVPVLGYITNNRLPGVALMTATTPAMLEETMEAAGAEMTPDEADALFSVK